MTPDQLKARRDYQRRWMREHTWAVKQLVDRHYAEYLSLRNQARQEADQ